MDVLPNQIIKKDALPNQTIDFHNSNQNENSKLYNLTKNNYFLKKVIITD